MTIFSNKSLFNTHFFYLILIFLFSFFINFYYAKFGSFPIDTFLHYDSAFRILNNEYPVRDYIDKNCYSLNEDELFYIFKIHCLK